MGGYESPCQIVSLFIGAILISCGIIYVLQLETTKRYGDTDDVDNPNQRTSGKCDKMKSYNNLP